jgi:hypothetical protein
MKIAWTVSAPPKGVKLHWFAELIYLIPLRDFERELLPTRSATAMNIGSGGIAMLTFQLVGLVFAALFFGALISSRSIASR